MKRETAAASSVVVLLLAGCAVVESSTGTSGLAYHLPKGSISITAERKKITTDEAAAARKAESSAKALVEDAKTALAAAKKSLETNQGASAADPSIGTLQVKIQLDQAFVNYWTARVKGGQQRVEEAKAKADDLANAVGKMQETATISVLPVGPDPSPKARFVANLNHLPTRDDGMKLGISNNGLLSSSETTSTDETGKILVALAEIVAAFGVVPPSPTVPRLREEEAPTGKCEPYSLTTVFDPTIEEEFSDAQQKIAVKGIFTLVSDHEHRIKKDSFLMPEGFNIKGTSGLFYRVPINIKVNLASYPSKAQGCGFKSAGQDQTVVATVPDSSQTFVLPLDGGAFTTVKESVTFNNGMPIVLNEQRPSEVLAALRIPIDVVKAFISIPTELIKLRLDYDSQAAADLNAKVESLKAQLEAIRTKQAIESARPEGANMAQ